MIRKYQPGDLEELLTAWAAASELAHPFLSSEFLAQEHENIPNLYLPNTDTWVAEVDGKVVGFISLLGNEVGALFVHPDYHGQSHGRALMDKARELHGRLEVEVFAANNIGRAFYDRYGFVPDGEKVHAETGFALWRLRFPADN